MWILAAAGVRRATSDDTSMLPPYNHLPPKRSAAQPPGTYTNRRSTDNCNMSYIVLARVSKTDHCQVSYPPISGRGRAVCLLVLCVRQK